MSIVYLQKLAKKNQRAFQTILHLPLVKQLIIRSTRSNGFLSIYFIKDTFLIFVNFNDYFYTQRIYFSPCLPLNFAFLNKNSYISNHSSSSTTLISFRNIYSMSKVNSLICCNIIHIRVNEHLNI